MSLAKVVGVEPTDIGFGIRTSATASPSFNFFEHYTNRLFGSIGD